MTGPIVIALALSACGSGSPGGDKVKAVAAGYVDTCALTSTGGVRCWGGNDSGQLGNGTTTDSATPVDVKGLTHGVIAIAAGGEHTCAVTTAGAVKCWGLNTGGQLGNGTNGDSSTPVAVKGLASGVRTISANDLHACALTIAGRVECWGSTTTGDVPQKTDSDVPVVVSGLGARARAVAAGGLHACAITSGGAVRCWGTNGEGELGNGSKTSSDNPVAVVGLTRGVTSLGVGSTYDYLPTHTCALTSAGGVQCWGPNGSGQLGDGSERDRSRPVAVSGLASGIIAIAVGGIHTCAITTAQRLECWGDNTNGQLGDGTTTNRPAPVDVGGA